MIDHLSYSSISAYLDCAKNWKLKYIDKVPTMSSPALLFGSAFHETVEAAVGGNNEPLLSIWGAKWAAQIEKQPVFWGADTPEEIFNDGVRMFSSKNVIETIHQIKPMVDEQGPRIERKIELRVPGVPIPIIGYIDIQTDDGTPSDLKTSARSWSDDKAADSMQSLFYIAGLNQAGEKVNWKFRHIVFVKTKEPKVQILEHAHNPNELFFLFELIRGVWNGIEKEVFPVNPTTWKCNPKYCDFWGMCRGAE